MGPPSRSLCGYSPRIDQVPGSDNNSRKDQAPRKIKCTYEDCSKHFKDEAVMKRHKTKDPDHFYCKRCDVDCDDDMSYMIHQIESYQHICCPACGAEFYGTSARDLHVEAAHRDKQTLTCVGCEMKLPGAAAYMAHIGKNECEYITLEDFERYRAEKQIKKDVLEAALETNNVIYGDSSRLRSEADTSGGVQLMDDDNTITRNGSRSNSDLDSRISPLLPTTTNRFQSTRKLNNSTANLSVDRYPALPAQSRPANSTTKNENIPPESKLAKGDLLDFDVPEERRPPQQQPKATPGAWATVNTASRHLFPINPTVEDKESFPSQSDLSDISNHETRTTITDVTHGDLTQLPQSNNSSRPREYSDLGMSTNISSSTIPAAARPQDSDPKAIFASVRTTTRVVPIWSLDPTNFYDDIRHKFHCEGKDCGRDFDTAEDFREHLETGSHASGKTQCPSVSCPMPFSRMSKVVSGGISSGGMKFPSEVIFDMQGNGVMDF